VPLHAERQPWRNECCRLLPDPGLLSRSCSSRYSDVNQLQDQSPSYKRSKEYDGGTKKLLGCRYVECTL
jgi:hypothetical protein